MNCLFTMKIRFKITIMILLSSILLFSTYSLEASVNDEPGDTRELNSDSTPPIIIFNTTLMSSENIIQILVYDAESNLSEVTILGDPFNLTAAENTFNVTWSYVNYILNPPPLSKGGETINPPADANTLNANISTDLFVEGDHNSLEVDAENEELLASTSTITFCNTYECWGRGGGHSNVLPETTLNGEVGVPIIHFDATGYYCCGNIIPEIIPNGAVIVNSIIDVAIDGSLLTVELETSDGNWHKSAVALDPDVHLNCLEDCDDCTCPTDVSVAPIFLGLLAITTVIILLKRKRKT